MRLSTEFTTRAVKVGHEWSIQLQPHISTRMFHRAKITPTRCTMPSTSSATKFTSGYDSKGKSVKYISAPAEHTHSWQKITKETQVKVVDKEAYTYEEPVYEKHDRTICKVCGLILLIIAANIINSTH